MDWASILKDYGFPLLTLGLGYLFGKWESERKRKWDVDDRDYKRRIEIHDMRIREARELVSSWRILLFLGMDLGYVLKRGENMPRQIDNLRERYPLHELTQATKDYLRKQHALDVLADDELSESANDYLSFAGEMSRIVGLANSVEVGGSLDINQEELDAFQDKGNDLLQTLSNMDARLDELAKTVK